MNRYKYHFQLLFLALILVLSLAYYWKAEEKTLPDIDSSSLLGDYYFNHGPDADGTYDLVQARAYYEKALRESPQGNNWTWYQLGRIDFLEGKFDGALYKFGKQIEYFGNDLPAVYYMVALTHGYRARTWGREEDWLLAAENFQRYLEFDPTSPWARTDLAWVYFAQGRYEDMKEPLQVGLETNPDNPWLLNMYGLALLNTGEREEAKSYLEKAKAAAQRLTAEEWGRSYPGNDPAAWRRGLEEFRAAIQKNLNLAS